MTRESPQFKLRMPEELRAEIARQAAAAGRSMNAEIVQRLEHSLLGHPPIPDYIVRAIRDAAALSGRTFENEFDRRMHDATDVFVPALREAIDPYRNDIQQTAELNGTTFKEEISRRLNPNKSAVTYGFELTIRNEAELTPAAVLQLLAKLSEDMPFEPTHLGSISVRLVAPDTTTKPPKRKAKS